MIFGAGSLLAFIGTVWLIVIAIQTGQTTGEKVLWALVNFLCQPLGGIIFYIVKETGVGSADSDNYRLGDWRLRVFINDR